MMIYSEISGANSWLKTSHVYEGIGKAEFSSPKGFLEGPTKVVFEEDGGISCTMTVEKVESVRPLLLGLPEFLSGTRPTTGAEGISLELTTSQNPCASLTIRTAHGQFTADRVLCLTGALCNGESVSFCPWRGEFTAKEAASPAYLAIPLWNFVHRFFMGEGLDCEHPLRFFKKEAMPISDCATRDVTYKLMNKVLAFPFLGNAAYIEPLPQEEQILETLKSGLKQRAITAVMVANLNGIQADIANVDVFYSRRLFSLIALGTGNEIGAPWMEVRSQDNALVKRLHVPTHKPRYEDRRELVYSSLTHLLHSGLAANLDQEDAWVVACKNLLRAGRHTASVEESLQHLFVALASLCKAFGVDKRNLLTEVGPSDRDEVRQALEATNKKLRDLEKRSSSKGKSEKLALDRVADRVLGAGQTDADFGPAVLSLMEIFKLPDAKLLSELFGDSAWFHKLSQWRGAVVHKGFLDLQDENDATFAYALGNHLMDILARILLMMVGFKGHYQPQTISMSAHEPLDWLEKAVANGMPVGERLGYVKGQSSGSFGRITLTKPPAS